MPSYTMDKATTYLTCGLGYRYQSFYIDAAYVYKKTRKLNTGPTHPTTTRLPPPPLK